MKVETMMLFLCALYMNLNTSLSLDIKKMYGIRVGMANSMLHYKLYPDVAMDYYGENFVYSPYMITYTLSMLASAADGETYQQLAELTGVPTTSSYYIGNKAIADLLKKNRGDPAYLDFACSIWYKDTIHMEDDYINLLSKYSDIILYNNSIMNANGTNYAINDVISARTNGRLNELYPKGYISLADKLVYATGMHFKPLMDSTFQSTVIDFYDEYGNSVKVEGMEGVTNTTIIKIAMNDITIMSLDLLYSNFRLFCITSSNARGLDTFLATLTVQKASEILGSSNPGQPLLVRLPTFHLESQFDAASILVNLNVTDAFDENHANLTKMTKSEGAYISGMEHTTIFDLNNEGVEGRVYTTGYDVITFDRQFAFIVVDPNFKTVLMAGKVVKPSFTVFESGANPAPSGSVTKAPIEEKAKPAVTDELNGEVDSSVDAKSFGRMGGETSGGGAGISLFISTLTIVCPILSMLIF